LCASRRAVSRNVRACGPWFLCLEAERTGGHPIQQRVRACMRCIARRDAYRLLCGEKELRFGIGNLLAYDFVSNKGCSWSTAVVDGSSLSLVTNLKGGNIDGDVQCDRAGVDRGRAGM